MNSPDDPVPPLQKSTRAYLVRFRLIPERMVDELSPVAAKAVIRRHKRKRLRKTLLMMAGVSLVLGLGHVVWNNLDITYAPGSSSSVIPEFPEIRWVGKEERDLEKRLEEMIVLPLGYEEGIHPSMH